MGVEGREKPGHVCSTTFHEYVIQNIVSAHGTSQVLQQSLIKDIILTMSEKNASMSGWKGGSPKLSKYSTFPLPSNQTATQCSPGPEALSVLITKALGCRVFT